MTVLFIILIILAAVILSFIVLVQNPKGGGLSASIGGFSDQFMGVKQTTDVLEKGTWVFAGAIGLLSIASVFFISKSNASTNVNINSKATEATVPVAKPATPPANTITIDSNKK